MQDGSLIRKVGKVEADSTEYLTAEEILASTRSEVASPIAVASHQSLRIAASLLFTAILVLLIALVFVPWVQNVQGIGSVIAYSPDERQQHITAPVDGLIRQWFVLEGSHVKKGDNIVDIADIDPDIMNRLEREREATQTKLDASQKALDTSRKNLERQKSLVQSGLSSMRSAELAELEYAKYLSEISSASAELARIETRIARQASQSITAPRDGIVQRIFAPQGGVMVKSGQELALIVPETANRSVELKVGGNDAPLLSVGRVVRLQFEGWPAVQFAGWPSVAIGTFGGHIGVIDQGADAQGNVRIIVFPDEGTPWPDARYLRQGVRVVGWILLDTVTLGWELWRQFNGFPPTIQTAPPLTVVQGISAGDPTSAADSKKK
ncbi:MAG: efflux RND transporter periplasmic adaptor subunit [Pseudomonadota bacterium]|jgi:multidrug efflux pump subunit AcrA (membrane-fusion protein)